MTAVSSGYCQVYEETVPITPRAKQLILGFNVKLADTSGKITDHYYYFIAGCQIGGPIDRQTFDYQFRPESSLTGRVATALWERTF